MFGVASDESAAHQMNRDDYLHNCAKYLGRLSHEIRALNAIRRFDINSVTEDFLIPILKVTFDCPELRNQNEIQLNFPSVDLGCEKSRKSFQITTDASSDKVVKTLQKFREHNLGSRFDKVYVITISEKQSSYKAKALDRAIEALPVPFDPSLDILDIDDLLTRVDRLETSKLERIEAYLASEFNKRDEHLRFREQLDKFIEYSQIKIEVEKKSKKYIPSIFVETHKTKEQMRFFAHPLFFYRRLQDLLSTINYTRLNSLFRLAKEPEVVFEIDGGALTAAPSTFAELDSWLKVLDVSVGAELKKLRPLSWGRAEGEARYEPVHKDSVGWSIVRVKVESIATGVSYRLKDAKSLLQLMQKKIFLVTSMAGQGKTNFVCDLVENQFRPFEIPCVYIPGRELNGYAPRQRLFGFISNNRYAPTAANIHDCFGLFDSVAKESGKPFLIVIDGINEVAALDEFSGELKEFCNSLCQYDNLKVVITCRSEFFDKKYASILDEPFSRFVHRVTDLRSEMSDASKARLLKAYLAHFNIKGHLAGSAEKFLENDLLLLRIFCERYEGQSVGYTKDIYKGDLFEEFLFRKIEAFPERLRGKAFPTLLKVASAMLAAGDYSKLSVGGFPSDEQEIIQQLVAEDVILRQEIGERNLEALGELAISFTYDELRDFVIAYKLVQSVTDNAELLMRELSSLPDQPIFEGVYRYVYLLARKWKKVAGIEACERADDFVEHFVLNVHLLPPTVQNADDVARLRTILADTSNPRRVRRAARFLVNRPNVAEPLNAGILIEHLNSLTTDEHEVFVRAIFSGPHDLGSQDWRGEIDELVQSVQDRISGDGLGRYPPSWLAFFLHASSLANWSERERASTLFRSSGDQPNCLEALNMVRPAQSQAISFLLSDIDEEIN